MENNDIVQQKNRNHMWNRKITYIVVFLFWLLFYWHLCVENNTGDYYAHNTYAEYIKEGRAVLGFYPLYHILVIIISYLLMNCSCQIASAVLLALSMCASIEITRRLLTGLVFGGGISFRGN